MCSTYKEVWLAHLGGTRSELNVARGRILRAMEVGLPGGDLLTPPLLSKAAVVSAEDSTTFSLVPLCGALL